MKGNTVTLSVACFCPPLSAFTWFDGYHHAWLEWERSGYIWGIVNIHAQVMAHMMRAVLSNSLREDGANVTAAVKNSPTCSNRKDREETEMCFTSSLTATPRLPGSAFHLLELDGP